MLEKLISLFTLCTGTRHIFAGIDSTEFKIERRDDNDTISNKVFDFSSNTISRLMNQGIHDTLTQLVTKHKESSNDNTREQLEKFINDIKEPNTEEEKYMIDSASNLLQSL